MTVGGGKSPTDRALAKLRVAKKYGPHQDGAKRFARRFGAELVCVRHRVSEDGLTRFTTIELLAEVTPIVARQHNLVMLRPPSNARSLRVTLLAAGAAWDTKLGAWLVPLAVAKRLRLMQYLAVTPG